MAIAKSHFLKIAAVSIAASPLLFSPTVAMAQAETLDDFQGVWLVSHPVFEVGPSSGDIPFTQAGRERYEDNLSLRSDGLVDDYDITRTRCSNPGPPRLAMTPMRFKIWVYDQSVTFDYEWNRAIRQIDLSGAEVELPLVPSVTGIASGSFSNGTFVARTIDVADKTLIDDVIPHSDQMIVTEHYRLLGDGTLENRVTIDDSEYFTEPWDFVITYQRQPDTIFPEDICLDRIEAGGSAFPGG